MNKEIEIFIESAKLDNALTICAYEQSCEAVLGAIKYAFLINGGGAIALLPLLNSLFDRPLVNYGEIYLTTTALLYFLIGVGVAGIAATFNYISNYSNVESLKYQRLKATVLQKKWSFCCKWSNNGVIVWIASSYFRFFSGGISAYIGFS